MVIFYLLELGLEPDAPASTADRGVWISILNLAVAVTLVTWPGPAGEELREEPVLEPCTLSLSSSLSSSSLLSLSLSLSS